MTAVMPQRPTLISEPVVLTAQQYDALPPNNRMELVDGVVTLMTPATRRHQIVVQKVRAALESGCPEELRIVWEQEIRLADLLRRNPDVEVVSPHTHVTDRLHKPAEYAAAGIEHYWRVETLPEVAVHTYRLADSGSYVASGVFTEGDTIGAPGLPWAKIQVSDLSPAA